MLPLAVPNTRQPPHNPVHQMSNVPFTKSRLQCRIDKVSFTKSRLQCRIYKVSFTMSHLQSLIYNVAFTKSRSQCRVYNVACTMSRSQRRIYKVPFTMSRSQRRLQEAALKRPSAGILLNVFPNPQSRNRDRSCAEGMRQAGKRPKILNLRLANSVYAQSRTGRGITRNNSPPTRQRPPR